MNQNQIIRQLCQLNDKVNILAENGISSQLPSETPLFNKQITDLEVQLNDSYGRITKLETTIKNNHKEGYDRFVKMNEIVLKLEQHTKNIEKESLKITADYTQMKKNYTDLFEKMNGMILKSETPP
jgi:predicted  nucleic acid-binding Zn-ribbon protein